MSETPIVGPWAKEKLEALGRYLDFYTKVLKNQRWDTIYVDAFAGGGRAVVRADPRPDTLDLPLLEEGQADQDQIELINGSPRVALDVANPFGRYVFIDPNPSRAAELEALRREYHQRRIDVLQTEASDGIEWVVANPISRNSHRGVAFLDPFGANLNWSSVQHLADTRLFEVVVNLGINMTIQRMLPNSGVLHPSWRTRLDAYFGTASWYQEVYRVRNGDLFGNSGLEKYPDYHRRLLELYRSRLKQAFGHVSSPRLIRNTRGSPLYYLVWAGPHAKGREGADYILNMGERMKSPAR